MTPTREQLASIEWQGWCRDDGDACPACGRRRDQGHNAICWIAACLATPEPVTDTPQGKDDSRCAVCGWPLDPEGKMCRRGDCSLRPMPEMARDAARAVREYEAEWNGAINSPTLERWRAQAAKQSATPEPQAMPPIEPGDWYSVFDLDPTAIDDERWVKIALGHAAAGELTEIRKANGTVWTREPRR